jgi:RimJ/RimL family protein N-acetyltransferase
VRLIQIKHRHGRIVLFRSEDAGRAARRFEERKGFSMPEAADYSVVEQLRDGRSVEIRALRPDDRAGMLAAIGRTSPQSLRTRFFAPKKGFSEQEMAFFLDVDFDNHVALVAQIDEDGRPVIAGGGRYIVVEPGQAEIAFVVVDAYQGQGIGSVLMRHLAALAREAGLKELIAEVLPENTAMLKVFKNFGFRPISKRDPQLAHLALQLS